MQLKSADVVNLWRNIEARNIYLDIVHQPLEMATHAIVSKQALLADPYHNANAGPTELSCPRYLRKGRQGFPTVEWHHHSMEIQHPPVRPVGQ
jgi:hypothetical protein